MGQRLTLKQIKQRLAGIEEGETRTFHLREGKIIYVRSEGGAPALADYHAWIPDRADHSLFTYTGEARGLMTLIAQYRKRPLRTKRPKGTEKP